MTTNIPYLTEADVAAVLTWDDLIPLMAEALIDFSSGSVVQPTREMLTIEPNQRFFAAMPAAAPNAMGAKMVAFYPKNAASGLHTHFASIALFDPETGQPLAFMDGRLITEMRTAATSAAVTRTLAPPESRSIALLGSGVQAKAHLQALKALFPVDDVRVWSRTEANARAFAKKHGARSVSAEEAVRDADIIVCATAALEPVLQGAWLKPGCHVNSVGSPRPDWREMDDATMQQTVIVDSRAAAMKEAGDVILSGAIIHAEAGEVLSGTIHADPASTTVFKSVGIAVEDVTTAQLVYDRHMSL